MVPERLIWQLHHRIDNLVWCCQRRNCSGNRHNIYYSVDFCHNNILCGSRDIPAWVFVFPWMLCNFFSGCWSDCDRWLALWNRYRWSQCFVQTLYHGMTLRMVICFGTGLNFTTPSIKHNNNFLCSCRCNRMRKQPCCCECCREHCSCWSCCNRCIKLWSCSTDSAGKCFRSDDMVWCLERGNIITTGTFLPGQFLLHNYLLCWSQQWYVYK